MVLDEFHTLFYKEKYFGNVIHKLLLFCIKDISYVVE